MLDEGVTTREEEKLNINGEKSNPYIQPLLFTYFLLMHKYKAMEMIKNK